MTRKENGENIVKTEIAGDKGEEKIEQRKTREKSRKKQEQKRGQYSVI